MRFLARYTPDPHTGSGALGAGLVLFSKYPILAATVHPYSLNGTPADVLDGDWFVGKAAASILVAHPILGQVQIYNTHVSSHCLAMRCTLTSVLLPQLFAKGGDEGPDHHKAHRLVNAWEFAKLARQAAEVGRYVIAAGDFNSVPQAPPMAIIREHAQLKDAWLESHPPQSSFGGGIPTPSEAINAFGVTCDSPLNFYSAGKTLEPYARKYQGKRLDYIFYRQPSSPPASDRTPLIKCVNSKVAFTDPVPGYNFSFSDHFGLEATFEISLPGADVTNPEETYVPAPAEPRSPSFVLTSVPNPNPAPPPALSSDLITSTLQSLMARYRFAQSQARFHLSVFAVCLFLLLVFIIGSAWLPKSWINPIFMILTIFLAWLSTTMLYIGFVYGRWELNALTNIIEELEIYRSSLEGRRSGELLSRSSR